MDWLQLFVAWFTSELLHWTGTVPAFTSWITTEFAHWMAATLAAGNAGHPPQGAGDPVSPGATPELDSLVLFGTGLLGAGGYALTRIRARRRA